MKGCFHLTLSLYSSKKKITLYETFTIGYIKKKNGHHIFNL